MVQLFILTVYSIRMPARGGMGPITFIVKIKLRGNHRMQAFWLRIEEDKADVN